MVAERSRQGPGPEEVARDVGYSSDGSLPRSDREGPSADPFSTKIAREMDGSCDASGECTTDDSDDRPPTRKSEETVSVKRDRKNPEWRKFLSSRRRGRPRSMTELYKRKSPDVSLFASNAELSAWPGLGSPIKPNSPRLRSRWRRSRLARSSIGSTPSAGSERGIWCRESSTSASSDPEGGDRSPSSDFRAEESDSNLGVPITAEETSSVSDQVWDGYQDPLYLSESYSESTVDQEEFKKVTEFGDDYGVLMEGSSDHFRSPKDARIPTPQREDEERSYTDSDEEDFRYVIDQANRAWQVAGNTLSDTNDLSSCQKAELIATCRAHLRCLGLIDDHLRKGRENTRFHLTVRGLIEKWETMEEMVERVEEDPEPESEKTPNGEDGEEERRLRKRLEELEESVLERETEDDSPAASFQRLEEKIESLQVSLRALQETRERLLEVNLKVRRLNHPSLSEKVAESYRLWERVYRRNRDLSAELRLTRNLWSRFLDLSARLRKSSDFPDQESTDGRKEMRSLIEELERRLLGSPALPGIREAAEWVESEARHPSEEEGEEVEEEEEEEEEKKTTEAGASEIGPEEEEAEKKEPSLLRRILRVAIPVQLALVLLYCLARLLEPRCCDSVNNLHFSSAPQLRYVRGPPPL